MTTAPPFNLLLVEDSLADAALFRDLLSEVAPEIELHHVQHGQEALDYLLKTGKPRPRLILLDLGMPVMDGHEFLRQAKQHAQLRMIPVLVLTNSQNPEDLTRAFSGQSGGYMLKPKDYETYRDLIRVVDAYWHQTVRLPTIEQMAP